MYGRVDIGDWCVLYHADATEIMDVLREHEPDAVIMDPPYGLNRKRQPGGRTLVPRPLDTRSATFAGPAAIHGDDGTVSIRRFTTLATTTFIWGADHLRDQLPSGGRFVAWDKTSGHEFSDDFSDVEFGWHSRAGKSTKIHHLWKGGICDYSGGDTVGRDHPMQKPIRVMEWCIEQCRLEPGETILDPYMGSGTTAIAAFKRRMKFVGVEIDRRWFDVAIERINRQTADGPLFDGLQSERQAALL